MRSKDGPYRGSLAASTIGLAGVLIAASVVLVGAFVVAEGILQGSLPLMLVGLAIAVMGALGSVLLPREMRGLAPTRGEEQSSESDSAAETSEAAFASEHRRRQLTLGLTLVPLVAFLFLAVWSVASGTFQWTLQGLMALLLLLGVLASVVAYSAVSVMTDTRFALSEQGVVPRHVPLSRAIRGRHLIEFTEVDSVIDAADSSGEAVLLKLRDGTVVSVDERDGIPREAVRRLVNMLEAKGVSPRKHA